MNRKRRYFIVFCIYFGLLFCATQAVAQSLPDLEMEYLSFPKQIRGYGSKIRVDFRIKNTGKVNAGSFFVNLYYSDASTGQKQVYLGQKWITGLVAGKVSPDQALTLTLPNESLYGTRYILYFIDSDRLVPESNENNNFGAKGFQITGKPNLQVLYLGAAPQSQVRSGILQVSYRVYNAGYSRIPREFLTRFYFSVDSTITPSDTYLSYQIKIKSLKAQEFIPGSFQAKVPAKSPLGTAYLGAITDLGKNISESNESDNTQSVPLNIFLTRPAPDFVAVKIKVTPKTQQEGKVIQVEYTITNQGNQVSKAFQLGFYFSKTPAFNKSSARLYKISFSTLMVGQSKTGTISFRLPTKMSAGPGYIGIFVDHLGQVKESDESNNTKFTSITIIVDRDKDGYTNDKDCNDNDKTIYPGAKELCDGKDNDCDGETDEGCPCQGTQTRACYPNIPQTAGIGLCKVGKQTCTRGNWGACIGVIPPQPEICDRKDNNCNGKVDEDLFRGCYTGQPTTLNKGTCREGFQACIFGAWESCKGQSTPQPEGCDGKDNDCDGMIDDGLRRTCYSAPGDTIGKGICKQGVQLCTKGAWSTCQGEVSPTVEICDGKDNDCDGQIDNQAGSPKSLKRNCSTACGKGEESCKKGKWLGCDAPACTEPTEGGRKEGGRKEGGRKEGGQKENPNPEHKEGNSKENTNPEHKEPNEGNSKENTNPEHKEGPKGTERADAGEIQDNRPPNDLSEKPKPDKKEAAQDRVPDNHQNDKLAEALQDQKGPENPEAKDEITKDRQPKEVDYESINLELGNDTGKNIDDITGFPHLRATGGCGCHTGSQANRAFFVLLFSCILFFIPLYRRSRNRRFL